MKTLALAALSSALVVAVCVTWAPAAVRAQAAAASTTVTLTPAAPSSVKGQLIVSAKLAGPDGRPVSGQEISFYVPVELFGNREAYVGSATTDATGVAALGYQPAQVGRQQIIARFSGASTYAPSEASRDVEVSEVAPAFRTESLPFAGLREWLPMGLIALVIVVWGILLGVFVGTVRAIRRAA
jgi:hypothetical protein